MADKRHLRPMPPSIFRRMRALLDGTLQPLAPLSEAERLARLAAMGLGPDGFPSDASELEKEANRIITNNPGVDPRYAEETNMDPKPGWQTSEFWLTAVMTLVVIPVLGWLANQAVSPLGDILSTLASGNAILAAVVLAVKPALFAFLAWAVAQLTAKYAASRATVKAAHYAAHGVRRAA